jgi:putative NIF3 family GTP cyclohydrolase 1 type 2
MIAGVGAVEAVVAAMLAAHPYEEPAFDVYDSRSNLGMAGRVGRFSGDLAAVAARVRSELGETGVRVAGNPRHPIHRVAVVPGSGGSFLGEAVAAGADVLVTGDVGHHTVVEALDRGVTVIDAGHAPTERPGMRALVETVARIGVDVVDLTGFDPTPWR